MGPQGAIDRVALFSQDMASGAFSTVFSGLAWALAENGVGAIELLTVKGDMGRADHPFPPVAAHVRLPGGGSAGAVPALARQLREARPDVLISGPIIPNCAAVAAACLARSWRGLLVLSHHHPIRLARSQSWKNNPMLTQALYRRAHGSFAVSPSVREEAIAVAGLDPERVAVIPNALPPPAGGADDDGQAPVVRRGAGPVFITVGRLEPVKNLPLLLEAFARLPTGLDARLVVVGTGSEAARLKARAATLGIAERVGWLGHVGSPRPHLRAADAFVLASDEEGFGQVLVEAMAEGLPVVATDAAGGGVRYVLDDGRAGLLVPRRDVAALSAAMATIVRPEVRGSMAARARVRAGRFSPARIGTELCAFLHQLAGHAGARP